MKLTKSAKVKKKKENQYRNQNYDNYNKIKYYTKQQKLHKTNFKEAIKIKKFIIIQYYEYEYEKKQYCFFMN